MMIIMMMLVSLVMLLLVLMVMMVRFVVPSTDHFFRLLICFFRLQAGKPDCCSPAPARERQAVTAPLPCS